MSKLQAMCRRHRSPGRATLVAIAFGVIGSVAAAQDSASRRAEQLQFDRKTGGWMELAEPDPSTPEGALAIARRQFTTGEHKSARKSVALWMKSYGDHPSLGAAILLSGQVEKALGNYYKAYEILNGLVDEYRGTDVAGSALEELFNIAEVYLSGVKRKVWGIRLISGEDVALDILDRISVDFSESSLAELALKTKADYFMRQSDYLLAEIEYSRLLRDFPNSRYARYAMRQSADAALAGFRGVLFDDAPLVEAEERYRVYQERYPGVAEQEGIGLILGDIREKRASKEYEIGHYYQRTGQTRAAGLYYESTVVYWPDTVAASRASARLRSLTGLAPDNSGESEIDVESESEGES